MWSKDQNDHISKRSVQLVNIVQTEIFQSYVVDAIHVIPRDDVAAHNDNFVVRVVYAP